VTPWVWIHRRYLAGDWRGAAEWQPSFIATLLLTAHLGAVCLTVAYLVLGRQEAALALGIYAGVMLVLLELSRSVRTALLPHVAIALTLAAEVGMVLTEPTLDSAMLLWLGILPTMASLVLGWLAGAAWLLIGSAAAVVLWALRPTAPEADLGTLHLMRLGAFAATVYASTVLFGVFRRRAVDAAMAGSRARMAFLATMSHEIRTPMNGVLGMTEVLLQGRLDDEQREHLSVIQHSGQALVALLNDLLDLSKVEASKLSLEAQPFSLREVLQELAQLHGTTASLLGLTLELRCEGDVPAVVRGDALRLRQVLGNLLGNAVKFTELGKVALHVTRSGQDRLRFQVADTGVGMSASGLAGLFEPFQQVDASATRRFAGTGLGLALSRRLVRLMGGELSVASAVGEGSTFTFEVALPEAVLPPRPAAAPASAPAPAGRKVLVVDDNRVNTAVARALLGKLGYEVETAVDGVEAVAAVEREAFALVLMDCQMPRMNGFEATLRIRSLGTDAARTHIVALTASAMPEELEACRRAGMEDCLTKPLALAQLREVLRRFGLEAAPIPAG
jgi:signal transduction histidine kinase/CheY-like chemotaxis protein